MLEFVLTAFFTLAVIVGVIVLSGYFWQWYYSRPTSQDETLYLTTADGWRLAVHHYRPEDERKGLPVILCHGLSSNRHTFDLPGGPSLARFLRSRGRDVWTVELRGSGMSDRPRLFYSDFPYDWEFEEHLREDVPAVIDFVLDRTGAPKVHWVGHSMGGMLILAHVSGKPDAAVASAVTVGSPVDFSDMRTRSSDFLLKVRPLFDWLPISPLPIFGRFLTPIAHMIPNTLLGLFHAPNMSPEIARKTVALASQLVTSNHIWLTFGRYIESGTFAPKNGKPYLEGLAKAKAAILFIGGSRDGMAPHATSAEVCTPSNPGGERCCLIVGKESGFASDYGHMDLVLGKGSEDEIFPRILAWLEQHDRE